MLRDRISTARRRLSHPDLPLFTLVAVAVGAGAWLRIQHFDFPGGGLDEGLFIGPAEQLAHGHPDTNDHPPLGKLLMAIPIALLGGGPASSRLAQLVIGLMTVPLAFFLGKKIFSDARAGCLAALFVAIDGPFIAYSRAALLDGMLVAAMMLALFCALSARPAGWLLAGLGAGMAASIKLSAAPLTVPIALAIAQRTGSLRRTALWVGLAALGCVVAYYCVGLIAGLAGHVPEPWLLAWTDTRSDVLRHVGMTGRHHPMNSRWYTWFVPKTVVTFSLVADRSGTARMMTMAGNPLLWWTVPLAVLAAALLALRGFFRALAQGRSRLLDGLRAPEMQSYGVLLFAWVAPLVPWMITDRDSYLYHYVPSYAFGLVALAGLLARLYRKRPMWVLAAVGAVVVVAGYYAAVWGHLPRSFADIDRRMFLWR